ncbi:hypothetical protein [Microbacterium aurum]
MDVFERRPSGETKTYRQNVTTIDRHGRTFIDTISSAEAEDPQRSRNRFPWSKQP